MFTVALIGPDGAGKTTIAKRLERSSELQVKYLYMGIGHRRRNGKSHSRNGSSGKRSFSWLRNLRRLAVLVGRSAEEWYRQAEVWTYRKQNWIVVCDRHYRLDFADEIGEPSKRRDFVDRLHRWLLTKLYPMPDLVIYLDAPGERLFARKRERSPEWLESRRQAFLRLGSRLPNFIRVDAARPLEVVEAGVLRHILDFQRAQTQAVARKDPKAAESHIN